MKKIAFTATAATILLGTTALAGPVEDLIAQLTADGYTNIEVEQEGDTTEIEAMLNGKEREIEINTATGEILSDQIETDHDEADEDDDDENEADDDEDGDDDEKDDI